ncbi:MAG TPA: DUF4159 domain-containing protein [Verrucomicrobiae bacterium]|nr:DUF4159 domain-containing protein [Verrucomicrobiae bacterium]
MEEEKKKAITKKLRERILGARFFVGALFVHAVLFLLFAGVVVFEAFSPRRQLEAFSLIVGDGLGEAPPMPPPAPTKKQDFQVNINKASQPQELKVKEIITAVTPNLTPNQSFVPTAPALPTAANITGGAAASSLTGNIGSLGKQALMGIKNFQKGWIKNRGSGSGTGPRGIVAEFTVHIGQLSSGGDSLAFVRFGEDKKEIIGGSVPNLAEMINRFSKGKIKCRVQGAVLRLDSPEIYETKPPFIYITGRSDFKLTDAEVLNLRKYLLLGGCIWGDNALPGKRSRFDIAFRREMKRVIPDADKPFEPLADTHAVYNSLGYFRLPGAPAGLNFSHWPVEAIKIDGIEAVIYTVNGYGAMWQVTFDETLQKIDNTIMQRAEKDFWEYRKIFYRNLNEETLNESYKLGINIVAYLLLRYETKLRTVPDV